MPWLEINQPNLLDSYVAFYYFYELKSALSKACISWNLAFWTVKIEGSYHVNYYWDMEPYCRKLNLDDFLLLYHCNVFSYLPVKIILFKCVCVMMSIKNQNFIYGDLCSAILKFSFFIEVYQDVGCRKRTLDFEISLWLANILRRNILMRAST